MYIYFWWIEFLQINTSRRDGLVVSMSASHVVGSGFMWVVCGTVYGDMHYKISWDQSQEKGIVSRSRIPI